MTEQEQRRDFLLAALRSACVRAKLIESELTAIGIALKHEMVDVDGALKWIYDEGLFYMVNTLPVGMVPEPAGLITEQE